MSIVTYLVTSCIADVIVVIIKKVKFAELYLQILQDFISHIKKYS